MQTLFILSAMAVIGYCVSPDQYFGTVDPLEYKENVPKLNAFIGCMLRVALCQGLDARIQARAAEIIASSCGSCDEDEKAVVRDMASLVAQRNPKILKGILKRYGLKSQHGKSFVQAINTFPSKAHMPNITDF